MTPTLAEHAIIGRIFNGSTYATARMPWGHKPGPIRLPTDRDDYERLIGSHLLGHSATVDYCPADKAPSRVRVSPAVLSAFCPAADGRCRWLGIDLDAGGDDAHGAAGLVSTLAAAGAIAGVVRDAGLAVLTVRSGSGRGCHVWIFPPEPCELADGVLAVARLAGDSLRNNPHAFATVNGGTAKPGQAGAVELIPKSTHRLPKGWPLTLPFSGAARARGGGHAFDPATGEPCELADVPVCPADAWRRFVAGARSRLPRPKPRPVPREFRPRELADVLGNLDGQTADFLAGRVEQGGRNRAAFGAACSLLGRGVSETEAERLILDGAAACGLPAREARTAFASACGAVRAKRGRR